MDEVSPTICNMEVKLNFEERYVLVRSTNYAVADRWLSFTETFDPTRTDRGCQTAICSYGR